MAIDLNKKDIYFRAIPGHGTLLGVHKFGNKDIKPEIEIHILDYNEPANIPFESWGSSMTNLPEGFNLAKLLDPEDEYSDMDKLNDVEAAAISNRSPADNVQHYVDRENEIIAMLVSLQNLMKNDDGSMMHILRNRDSVKDQSYICLLYTSPSPRDH